MRWLRPIFRNILKEKVEAGWKLDTKHNLENVRLEGGGYRLGTCSCVGGVGGG